MPRSQYFLKLISGIKFKITKRDFEDRVATIMLRGKLMYQKQLLLNGYLSELSFHGPGCRSAGGDVLERGAPVWSGMYGTSSTLQHAAQLQLLSQQQMLRQHELLMIQQQTAQVLELQRNAQLAVGGLSVIKHIHVNNKTTH